MVVCRLKKAVNLRNLVLEGLALVGFFDYNLRSSF
jgi:hypothetical protein